MFDAGSFVIAMFIGLFLVLDGASDFWVPTPVGNPSLKIAAGVALLVCASILLVLGN
ncbi:hypothetical protein Acj9p143 [Acinetobacter phage Acj9]|uniref:Uncharacterized protein n=1 Tax=Acinetobacter phage Acj9 TaxID=760939 RepID=E5EPS7_9CAUD|nr:hypothetical protein Acj9p143 [Acinetobacter phage Acj9]ADG60043.1 hypothetical protein Acj9p143 [Acinetobacter phage Acj9]